MQRSEYLFLRRKFEPSSIKLVIIAESPRLQANIFTTRTASSANHFSRR